MNSYHARFTVCSLAFLLSLTGCVQSTKEAMKDFPPPVSPYSLTSADIQEVKAGVARGLKDPYSAMFGGMRATLRQDGMVTVCGYVNAKNSFGGYVGMTPFMGLLAKKPVLYFAATGMGGTSIETQVIFDMCHEAGVDI